MHIPSVLSATDATRVAIASQRADEASPLSRRILDAPREDSFLRVTLTSGDVEMVHHVPGTIAAEIARAYKSGDPIFTILHGKRRDRLVFINLDHVACIAHEFYRGDEVTA